MQSATRCAFLSASQVRQRQCHRTVVQRQVYLTPSKLGVVVTGGAEAAVHETRRSSRAEHAGRYDMITEPDRSDRTQLNSTQFDWSSWIESGAVTIL